MSQPSYVSAGAWNHAPPYSGPPPIPMGATVHPSDWARGRWTYNPAHAAQASTAAWAPAPSWRIRSSAEQARLAAHMQQQRQQAYNYNPYKKQPKPPSAEYLSTQLSDNPLGLSEMVPRKDLYGGDYVATPWQWNPRRLEEEDENEDADSNSDDSDHEAQNGPISQPSGSRHQKEPVFPSLSSSASAAAAAAVAAATAKSSRTLVRHSSEPPPQISAGDPPNRGISSASAAAAAAAAAASAGTKSASQPHPSTKSEPPEGFLTKGPLKPTFSTNIVRTPEFYQARRDSTSGGTSPTPVRSASVDIQSAASSLDRMTIGQTSSLSSSKQSMGRHSSLPNTFQTEPVSSSSRRSQYEAYQSGSGHTLVDEPDSMLSPLIIDSTPKPSSRSLGRGVSMPAVSTSTTALSPIAEGAQQSKEMKDRSPTAGHHHAQQQQQQPQHQHHHRSSSKSRKNSNSASPTKYEAYSHAYASRPASTGPSPSVSRRGTPQNTPPSTTNYTHSHNPLPSPPVESPYINSIYGKSTGATGSVGHVAGAGVPLYQPQSSASTYQPQASSSASASASAAAAMASSSRHRHISRSSRKDHTASTPSPPQATSSASAAAANTTTTINVRKGYWNRRGDHFHEGYVVYAPPNRAYPAELKGYPEEKDGFKDHTGAFIPYVDSRQEFPESLPRMGRPPVRPYESFISYVAA